MESRRDGPPSATPPAEFGIDTDLARVLLREQHPDLAELPIEPAESGWDNAMFRLGDPLALRLPRRSLAAALIEKEQRWLPELAVRLPLPVPAPLRIGLPGCSYPWRWSVVPWLSGDTADRAAISPLQAMRFGSFLKALHTTAPANAPVSPQRSVPLSDKAADTETRIGRLGDRFPALVRDIWEDGLAAPLDVAPTWIHGDLHARNVVVSDGEIAGVIDWGDLAAGDPATDLAAFWTVLPTRETRLRAMRAYGSVSDAILRRARGWAVFLGIVLLDTGLADHPQHAAMGAAILRRLRDEPEI